MHKLTAIAAAAMFLATSAVAGDKAYKKCDESAEACLTMMAGKFKDKGWVGIEYDFDADAGTLKVERVVPDSPAYAAKLKVGDVLVAVNGVGFAAADEEARKKATRNWKPGDTAMYTVKRGDTLSHIAQRHQVSLNTLRGYNDLKSDTVRVGDKLRIPPTRGS